MSPRTRDPRSIQRACGALALLLLAGAAQAQGGAGVALDWQVVAHPNNLPEPLFTFGSVPYVFSISKYEVTNEQYAEFLNAKATLGVSAGIYDPQMGTDPRGGIDQTGAGIVGDPFAYAVRLDMHQKPVNFVTWFDAARFVNWLGNGKGTGDMESGSYELLGANPVQVERDPNGTHFVPSLDEWFKAAYYDPGVGPAHYWGYPTRTGLLPAAGTATATGEIANPGHSVANYERNADWNGQDGHLTSVGSAGSTAVSFYGCADMGGNAYEWTDTIFMLGPNYGRLLRGGSWIDGGTVMHKSINFVGNPVVETGWRGFRVSRLEPDSPGIAYCFGVGCPCGNDDPGAGCQNSGGAGALLSSVGSASVAADDLSFDLTAMPANAPALLFSAVNALAGLPFGDGLRCAGGAVRRLGTQISDPSGAASYGPGLAAAGGWSSGETRFFQAWYRDLGSFCGNAEFNLSQGVRVDFQP